MSRAVVASGALLFVEGKDRDGHGTVLHASTAGGNAELSAAEASRVGAELLEWARSQAVEGGCTAGGDCPRHPSATGVHDPAFAERQVAS